MQMKPRSRDDHLVSLKLMINAYCTIGMFETAAAFFAFYIVFADYGIIITVGFTADMILGRGLDFRLPYADLSDASKAHYTQMCPIVTEFTGDCTDGEAFATYRFITQRKAQTAFLMTVVWCQVINIIIRKTSFQSVLSVQRLFGNRRLIVAIIIEV